MSLKRTLAIAKKEFIHIRRDYRSLILSFLIPIFLLILFGYALSLDIKDIPTTILDLDNSKYSREFISKFIETEYFTVADYVYDYESLEEDIKSGKSSTAIVIPPDFQENIISGKDVKIQTIIDGSNSNKASMAYGYIVRISHSFSSNILAEEKLFSSVKAPVDTEFRIWYNEQLESKNFMIPGLIAVIMMIIAALLTSLIISREWENGTMEQLIVSPIKSQELVVGKIIPYFLIGILDLIIITVLGKFVFNVPLRGSIILLFLLSSLFLIGTLSLGVTISIVAKSQLLSYQIAMLTSFLPSYILSGLVFPISSMPRLIQYISYLIPAKYFILILRGIFLKGNGIFILYLEALYLAIFAVVVFTIANLKFVKKLT